MDQDLNTQLAEALGETPVEEVVEEVVELEGQEGEVILEDEEELIDDDGEILTIADLARVNDWDASELYALNVNFAEGEEPISIGGMKDEISASRKNAEMQSQQLANYEQQMQQLQQQAQASYGDDQYVQQMMGKMQALEGFLVSPMLEQMKNDNPGGASLKIQEVNDLIQRTGGEIQQYQYDMQQQQQYASQQNMMGAQQYLSEHIPEWNDPVVANSEKAEVAEAFIQAGYNQQDVSQLSDPRAVMMARELVMLRKQVAGGADAIHQVQQSPRRSLRAARGITQANQKKMQLGKVLAKAQTGSRKDKVSASVALIQAAGGL